jgi:chemotaxis protein histidine kinase CheA
MDAEFDELKREFLEEAIEKVREIGGILDEGGEGRESIDRMLYLAHQLKGAGGSYGFSRISTEAAAMEAAFEKLLAAPQKPSADVRSRVEALSGEIESRMSELGSAAHSS